MKRIDLTFHTLASHYAHIIVPDEVVTGSYDEAEDWIRNHFEEITFDETEVDPITKRDVGGMEVWLDDAEDVL